MGRYPSGPSVRGILQARILEWVAEPFSRGIFPTQGLNSRLLHCRWVLYYWLLGKPHSLLSWDTGPAVFLFFQMELAFTWLRHALECGWSGVLTCVLTSQNNELMNMINCYCWQWLYPKWPRGTVWLRTLSPWWVPPNLAPNLSDLPLFHLTRHFLSMSRSF